MSGDSRVLGLLEEMLDAGSTPEEVCRGCPELLTEVRARWREFRLIDAAVVELLPGLQTTPDAGAVVFTPTAADLPEIPGYELLGEVGRGGMGIVYRARDVSLDRDVAVKFLQNNLPADSPIGRRFTDESRITAQLQHPGVPPVYRVGALPDGRPFLAMKLIKGRTLAGMLNERSDPAADRGRYVGIFEQICQAVAYAHSLGVIHRDLKPSNVMVGKFGEVQVMDWGVAKVLPGEFSTSEGEARGRPPFDDGTVIRSRPLPTPDAPGDAGAPTPPTRAGSVLGTPAYMAPEQAGGEVHRLDTRSDVFGLGAILCEVLTGQPPYTSRDEDEVVRKAMYANQVDAHARLADCQAQPELVALCLKCLAPEPNERPRNAGEVAAAVAALRAAAEERARRAELDRVRTAEQGKRRRVLLAASAAIVAVLLAGLSVSLWQTRRVAQERDDKDKALATEQKARELTMAALRDLTDDVVENELARGTQLTEENKEFLRKIIKHFESFAALTADDAASRAIRAEGYGRVGLMRHRLGEPHDAETAYGTAMDLQKQLADDFPARPEFRHELARIHHNLGLLLRTTGRLKEAAAAYGAALELQTQLAADFPTRTEFRLQLARIHNNLGLLFKATHRLKEAEAAYGAALGLKKQLAAAFPTHPEFRLELARSHNDLGILLEATGRLKAAEVAYGAALDLQKQLTADFPTRPEFRQELARIHINLGVLLHNTDRPKEAEAAYGAALVIRKQLAADFPARPEFREELARSHSNLGVLFRDTRRPKEAEAAYGAALDLQTQLAADFPTRPEFRRDLARSRNLLGLLLRDTGRPKEAEAAYGAALAIRKQLAADFPTRPEFRQELAISHNNLGNLLRDMGRLKEAETAYAATLALQTQLAADFPDQADLRNELAGTYVNLAYHCNHRRNFQAAKAYLEEARPHHQMALEVNPQHPTYRQFYRNNLWSLARANAGLLDHDSALQVAETIRDLGRDPPGNAYHAACVLAQCIPITAEHGELDTAQREEAATFYGDAAMKQLRDAVSKGYKDVADMKKNTDLDPLRQQDDFQKLVAELEEKGK